MFGFFFQTIAEKDAEYESRSNGNSDHYYGWGNIDPKTGRKLPEQFINSLGYQAGTPIERTCWGVRWWEGGE